MSNKCEICLNPYRVYCRICNEHFGLKGGNFHYVECGDIHKLEFLPHKHKLEDFEQDVKETMQEERIIEVKKVNFGENGNILSIGNDEKRFIRNYNGEPIYQIGRYVFYKGLQINFYIFDKSEAYRIIRHYSISVRIIDPDDYKNFMNLLSQNINPLANEIIMSDVVKKAKDIGYILSHSQIPDYIAYDTFSKDTKSIISKSELKWIHDHLKLG